MEQIAEAAMLLRRVAELTEDKSAINYIVAPLEIMVETGGWLSRDMTIPQWIEDLENPKQLMDLENPEEDWEDDEEN